MSTSLSESNLEKKFKDVTNTQDSIQTLSLWLLHHKSHHQKIVASWMKVLQKDKISHRLTMFYLANDVIQNSKRKGFLMFVNSFAEVLKEATLLVRDEHIRHSVQRVFTIWQERGVYTAEFVADLRAILTNSKVPATAPSKLLGDFKPDMVIKKMKSVMKMEVDSSSKLSTVNLSKLNATDAEIVQALKDRVHGQQFKHDFDKNLQNLEALIGTMQKEIDERNELILLLEQSEIYYDTQRGEAKVVANAYKNFDGRVKTLQKKLEELASTFPSPVPSPTVDAPSPTSDHELELELPNENMQTNEVENLEDAPSPVGSPEGLNLSPVPKAVESNSQPTTAKSVGNPIPTLSNFFSHEESGMTSWLGAFSSKKEAEKPKPIKTEVKKSDPSSLDSRLSNLLQNIPNLPAGLQSSIFASSGSKAPLQDSPPAPAKKEKPLEAPPGALTPLKDECSGQNTPLQDEDSHPFFNKQATGNKTQSPKDILKGLTNLIQSAKNDKDVSNKNEKNSFNSTELYEQSGEMSSFIKSMVSTSSQHVPSPSTYFTSSQSSMSAPIGTITGANTTAVASYQTTTFSNIPSYSTQSPKNEGHLSYIPSIVPSNHPDNFNFPKDNFGSEEYNPEMLFNTDMDLSNPDSDNEIPSPEIEALSPGPSTICDNDERPRGTIPGRRLSTLITVVTEDSPVNKTPPESMFSSDEQYKSDKENVTQELEPPWGINQPVYSDASLPDHVMKTSPNEDFFLPRNESSVPSYFSAPQDPRAPPNGENINYSHPHTEESHLSRIETVQSHREGDQNGRWFGNNWTANHNQNVPESPSSRHFEQPGEEFFIDNQNYPQPDFQPRQNWMPRHRPDTSYENSFHQKRNHLFSHRPYGPPQNKRFPARGRGWGRPQY
ncbi:hypothetical protein JTE90_014768 [Oedothorax gibbosus]|uniref:Regulation of nuclear pre-mRNA domain-containing protein 2 n=1 Tax=Oedothorax gibbosus TaxID=931172 RepID=A0AAV6UQW7_9ARAC|nr:hypothetical protein JTE90_014768 [Oedothorax gibbosus]